MLYDILAIIAGFFLLIWSADKLVAGAATVAKHLGIPPLIVGITIVGFGTSAPEIMVASIASLDGSPSLAIGNAIGSNIANITLVLGIAALITPLEIHSRIIKKELPLLLAATLLAIFFLSDNHLGRLDGGIFCGLLFTLMWWITRQALKDRGTDPLENDYLQETPKAMPLSRALFWLFTGLVLLTASSKLLIFGAVNIATAFGLSELIIGLTIIAVGTSLPELAASIAGAMKGEHDLAIGNVVGSNLFNTLIVLGIPGLIAPSTLDPGVLQRDIPFLLILTVILFIMAFGFRGAGRINRFEGFLLACGFFAYQALLYITVIGK